MPGWQRDAASCSSLLCDAHMRLLPRGTQLFEKPRTKQTHHSSPWPVTPQAQQGAGNNLRHSLERPAAAVTPHGATNSNPMPHTGLNALNTHAACILKYQCICMPASMRQHAWRHPTHGCLQVRVDPTHKTLYRVHRTRDSGSERWKA